MRRGALLAVAVGLSLGVLEEVLNRDALSEAVIQTSLAHGQIAAQVNLNLEGDQGCFKGEHTVTCNTHCPVLHV